LGLDGVFSEDALVTIYNSDLANDMGNLLNRTLTMVEKYFDGLAPEVPADTGDPEQNKRSDGIKDAVCGLLPEIKECLLTPKLLTKEALDKIMDVIGKANKYIEESAPWKYAKEGNTEAIKVIMADLLEVLRVAAIGIYPVMPSTAGKMWDQLGLEGSIDDSVDVKELTEIREVSDWRKFPAGTKVAKGDPLFPRIS